MCRICCLLLLIASAAWADDSSLGHAVLRAPLGNSEIVITTMPRLAGAIHSLSWNGKEFIDSTDHGRQLQSASNFDAGSRFTGETFNPTEAGSRRDGAGHKSTSKLLHLLAQGNQLQTTSQMAFWLAPGDKSGDNLAKNRGLLSNHLLHKRVTIGYREMPNVIQYDVTFTVPIGERHTYAQFEAVTGYMPAEFEKFWRFNPATLKLETLSDGPGEQALPVVLATASGSHAMGIYSPQQPSAGYDQAGYGRWRFKAQRVTKWNCVFRTRESSGIEPGEYSFRNFVVVGDMAMVREALHQLHREPGLH